MSVRQRVREAWEHHRGGILPVVYGVLAGLVLGLLVVSLDTAFSEDDDALVGRTVAYAVPALATVFLLLAWRSSALRAGFGVTAHALVTLYPFLLPSAPWWALGPALAFHLVALFLNTTPWTRLGVAALGFPVLVQVAYREDLGPYNPILAGGLLAIHLLLVWLLLPPVADSVGPAWRRAPQALLLGGLVLVFLGAGYSLTRALEVDRVVALVASAALAVAVVVLPRRLDAVRLGSIPVPAPRASAAPALPKA